MTKKEQNQTVTATLERRAEPRTKTMMSVLLKTANAHPMEACLLDISSTGARLRIPQEVPVGANIRIEAQDLLLFGIVKRCCLTHGAHEVGITLSLPLEMLIELRKLDAALLSHDAD